MSTLERRPRKALTLVRGLGGSALPPRQPMRVPRRRGQLVIRRSAVGLPHEASGTCQKTSKIVPALPHVAGLSPLLLMPSLRPFTFSNFLLDRSPTPSVERPASCACSNFLPLFILSLRTYTVLGITITVPHIPAVKGPHFSPTLASIRPSPPSALFHLPSPATFIICQYVPVPHTLPFCAPPLP